MPARIYRISAQLKGAGVTLPSLPVPGLAQELDKLPNLHWKLPLAGRLWGDERCLFLQHFPREPSLSLKSSRRGCAGNRQLGFYITPSIHLPRKPASPRRCRSRRLFPSPRGLPGSREGEGAGQGALGSVPTAGPCAPWGRAVPDRCERGDPSPALLS